MSCYQGTCTSSTCYSATCMLRRDEERRVLLRKRGVEDDNGEGEADLDTADAWSFGAALMGPARTAHRHSAHGGCHGYHGAPTRGSLVDELARSLETAESELASYIGTDGDVIARLGSEVERAWARLLAHCPGARVSAGGQAPVRSPPKRNRVLLQGDDESPENHLGVFPLTPWTGADEAATEAAEVRDEVEGEGEEALLDWLGILASEGVVVDADSGHIIPDQCAIEHDELVTVAEHMAAGDFGAASVRLGAMLESFPGSEFLWALRAHVELVGRGAAAAQEVLGQMCDLPGWYCAAALQVYIGCVGNAVAVCKEGLDLEPHADARLPRLLAQLEWQTRALN